MNRVRLVVVFLLCALCVVSGGSAVADSSYELSIPGSVDTQERSVTLQGNDYTVSNIGVVAPGEQISVDVTAPAGADYNVNLYNQDGTIISGDRMPDGSGTAELSGHDQAGSYIIAVYADGSIPTIHPLIISSYDVSLNAPTTVESGTSTEFSVDVSNVAGTAEDLDSVQIVMSNDGEEEALTATESGDGTYTASTTFTEEGEYLVYANVRGSDTANGRKELLGVSDSTTVEVQESVTATPSPTETGPSNGGGGFPSDPTTETPTATATTTPTVTQTATGTETGAMTPTPTSATESGTASPTATATETATVSPTATPSNVVTPNQSTPSPTSTTGGLSALVAVVAVLGFGALLRRR